MGLVRDGLKIGDELNVRMRINNNKNTSSSTSSVVLVVLERQARPRVSCDHGFEAGLSYRIILTAVVSGYQTKYSSDMKYFICSSIVRGIMGA